VGSCDPLCRGNIPQVGSSRGNNLRKHRAPIAPSARRLPTAPLSVDCPRTRLPKRSTEISTSTNKAITRLARSWAEMVIGTADCLEQPASPMTPSRPRRNRHALEKLTPRSVGGPDYKVIKALSRDIGMAEMSGHKPTRPYCLAPLFINSAYEARAWAAACRVRLTRRGAVGGSQPIRG
jgi:hypothetical protein